MRIDEEEFKSLVLGDNLKLEREVSPDTRLGSKVNLEWWDEKQFRGEIVATILNVEPSTSAGTNERVRKITVKPESSERKF